MIARMKRLYEDEILAKLVEDEAYPNVMAAPRLVKISVNMGVGGASQDIKELDKAIDELGSITGQ